MRAVCFGERVVLGSHELRLEIGAHLHSVEIGHSVELRSGRRNSTARKRPISEATPQSPQVDGMSSTIDVRRGDQDAPP